MNYNYTNHLVLKYQSKFQFLLYKTMQDYARLCQDYADYADLSETKHMVKSGKQ